MKGTVIKLPEPYYKTEYGAAYLGDALELVRGIPDDSVNLIMTSPPFALNKKKPYGNKASDQYVEWFKAFFAAHPAASAYPGSGQPPAA